MSNEQTLNLRQTAMPNLGSPPLMMNSPPTSGRKLSGANFNNIMPRSLLSSRKNSIQLEPQHPQIFNEEKYMKLYNGIMKDVKKTFKHLASEENSQEKQKIKASISKVIRLDSQEDNFNDRFGVKQSRIKRARTQSMKKPTTTGYTMLEKQGEKRKSFFTDHRKAIGLEEQCLLLEYYLKDQQTQKSQIKYLKGLEKTSRHRRITPTTKQNYQLYSTHDERQYKSLKKRVHIKEQFVEKCSQFAKKNSSYRRRQNFKEIQYVLNEHNKKIMEQTITFDHSQEELRKLQKNNKLIRLYLNYKFFPIERKVDEEETQKKFKKFKTDLFKIDSGFQFKEIELDKKMKEIYQYKHQKVIHFQDFKEIILFLTQLYSKDIAQLFQDQFPSYFINKKQQILNKNWEEIDKHLDQNKVKFLLEVMFKTFPDKIVGGIIIPIKIIPSIFKAYGISQKDFDLNELLVTYHWLQHHDAGITFEQFYKGSIMLKMKKEDWRGIESFLKKINIRKYL